MGNLIIPADGCKPIPSPCAHAPNGSPPGAGSQARPASSNGHTPPDDATHALAIARLIHGRRITAKARSAFPDHWSKLAEFVESSAGLEPAGLGRAIRNQYLANLRVRSPDTANRLAEALDALDGEDPGDEPDDPERPEGRPPFTMEVLDSATFFARDDQLAWLVRGVLVAAQPCVIGGPKKTLKTSILIDLAVSLATATPFLGNEKFVVERPMRVGFFSGESGPATIKDTALRVCKSKDIHPSDLSNLYWGFRLPQLSQADHLAELARVIRANRLEVVIIDPLYLCLLASAPGGRRLDASNLFDMGPLLSSVTETCLQAGATPLLAHHFKKNREAPHEAPELEDLAFAGIQEFARQWLLIGRRETFEPGSGTHRLWLTVGGSAGHSGNYALDVDEGVMDDDFHGRRWGVTVRPAAEARTEAKEQIRSNKAEAKTEAREREDAAGVAELVEILRGKPGHKATARQIRDVSGWRNEKAARIIARAVKSGIVLEAMVPIPRGAKTTDQPGFVLSDNREVVL